jgi:L-asparaginase II
MTGELRAAREGADPAGVPAHVPVAYLHRDGMIEGVHHGSVVVLAPDGSVVFAAGDIEAAHYPRSAAKPIQAVAMARLGSPLPVDLLALTTASHSGEPAHLSGVRRILASCGLTEDSLGTPPDHPYDAAERADWLASGREPSRLAHTCSGKHASMLQTAVRHGWSLTGYLSPEHPVQQEIAATMEALTSETIAHTAVDGCGSPLFAVSLRGLAQAIGRIAAGPPGTAEHRVAHAMRTHPDMVAGSRRDVTALMRAVPGLIAKDGFEAVQVAALPDGTAIAVKIADGADRARLPVTVAALVRAGVDPVRLASFIPARTEDSVVADLGQPAHP